ncbi:MAG: zinc-binding dehydrogenase [Gaiellaceae bacterium]
MEAVLVREGAVLSYETVADPDPRPGEAIVELKAAAVNRRDLLVRQGVYPFPLPLIPGSDGAGIRRDTGEEVVILPSLNWGPSEAAADESFEILGGPRNGTYAQLIAIPAENLYPKPARLTWEEAAAFPLAALTAYRALFAVGRLTSEECVLVLGAGSGVSTFAVQLAAEFGARVLVTSSSQEKIDRAVELGAKSGFLYTKGDWAEAAREATSGRGVDLVLDSVGSTWPDSVRALGRGGRVVVFGGTGGTETQLNVRPFYLQWLSLLGTTMGSPADFRSLLRVIETARWRPVIDSVRPLAEAEAAHTRMVSEPDKFGKLVLTCS